MSWARSKRTLFYRHFLFILCLIPAAAAAADGTDKVKAYRDEVEAFRQQYQTRLQGPTGWLTVAGLFWLEEGTHRVGSAPGSEVLLPESAPALVGTVERRGERVIFRSQPGVAVTLNGEAVQEQQLRPDVDGQPHVLTLGGMSLTLIRRAGRYALRLRDLESPMRRRFTRLDWYPVNPSWRIEARFVPYQPSRTITFQTVIGTIEESECPGYAEFRVNGKTVRLEPSKEGDRLFWVFRDQTAPRVTYGGGRFLYSDLPENGRVILDFNQAYNPPCAYTPFATCPLAPAQNRMPVRIEAGEKKYQAAEGVPGH